MYRSAQDHIASKIREKLKIRHVLAKNGFARKHPHAKTFLESAGVDLGKIREHAAHILTAGTIGSALLLGAGETAYVDVKSNYDAESLNNILISSDFVLPTEPSAWLVSQLDALLPVKSRPLPNLTLQEEKIIGKVVTKATKIPVAPVLEGERLNHVYGFIGAEQHLYRFEGDSISRHDELQEVGIAPSRGAFGYFADKDGLTEEAIEREKYYLAVQTLYLPNWASRAKHLKNWYKWRKMMVVNPDNGRAVVAVVGDAGPAAWTGKHFGGSPEVMEELGGRRYKKGRVLLYFVDDPDNKVSLGPVNYQIPDFALMRTPFMQVKNEVKPSKITQGVVKS